MKSTKTDLNGRLRYLLIRGQASK